MRRVIPGLESSDSALESEIAARLDRVEEELEKAVAADSDLLSASARYLLQAGGKRFRPMLVLLAGYFGDPADPRLIPGSVAIELSHLATLYHDDVIDESADRRGVPSANARWDNTVAILTGDYLFALASEMSADLGPDVCRLLARTITVLCDGQIREVDAAGRVGQDEDGYLEVIRRKTGSLIATSCRLGGTLSDATPEQVETLEAFGESLPPASPRRLRLGRRASGADGIWECCGLSVFVDIMLRFVPDGWLLQVHARERLARYRRQRHRCATQGRAHAARIADHHAHR